MSPRAHIPCLVANSIHAARQLTQTQSILSRTLERISSGARVNRSADDPAGLAVASRFNSDNKKIEYYDGANWQSSSFINVDDAEYDGAFTIEGTDYSNQTAGENSGVQRPGNNGTWLDFSTSSGFDNTDSTWSFQQTHGDFQYSKFLPAGHDRAHTGLTGDEARFGPAGSNTTQAEITSRYTPIMEIATNAPQTAMGNSYTNRQKAGALAFTTQTNDYIYSGFSQKFGGNKAFVSGVTNYMFGNSMGYYQNTKHCYSSHKQLLYNCGLQTLDHRRSFLLNW